MLAPVLTLALLCGSPPVSPFAAALRPSQRATVDRRLGEGGLDALPTWQVEVEVDPAQRTMAGKMRLSLKHQGKEPLAELPLRLFPNSVAAGRLILGAVTVGSEAQATEEKDPTTVIVKLGKPVAPGATLELDLRFTGDIPELPPDDTSTAGMNQLMRRQGGMPGKQAASDYGTFGEGDGIIALGDFHPVIAARRGSGFDLEPPTAIGDQATSDPANYALSVIVPKNQVVVASGVELGHVPEKDGRVRWSFAAAAARGVAVLLSDAYRCESQKAGDFTVRSCFVKGDEPPGKKVLGWAVAAMKAFESRFGPYPFSTFTVVESPMRGGAGGAEYTGLVTAAGSFYRTTELSAVGMGPDKLRETLEFVVAHEAAHQWWAVVVGSDVRAHPAVDESLAQYSALLYWETAHGAKAAEKLGKSQVKVNWNAYRFSGGADGPVDRSTAEYESDLEYAALVYGKAPYFYAALRKAMGDAAFGKALKRYYSELAFKNAEPRSFVLCALEESPKQQDKLLGLYDRWMEQAHGTEDLGDARPEELFGDALKGMPGMNANDPQVQALLKEMMRALGGTP